MKNSFVLAAAILASASLRPATAFCEGDIVFGARFYNAPQKSVGRPGSRARIYRVSADGTGLRPITRGENDDQGPRWAPDKKRISFVRDGEWVCVANADGSGLRKLARFSNWPVWSPDGTELGMVDGASRSLLFVNATSGKQRKLADVAKFAWSPDGKQLAWTTTGGKLCVANLGSASRTYTKLAATSLAWAAPQVLVASTARESEADGGGIDALVVLDTAPKNTEAKLIRRVPIRATLPESAGPWEGESDVADWRSELLPVPGRSGEVLFRWDNSTSSGRDGFYLRALPSGGPLKLLAHGQSFGFAPGGRKFAYAPYYELSPYNAPGQRKKWVYTSPLKVRDEKGERTLVSGLVLIYGCDWR